jgi:hypothetical protein
VIRSGVLLHLLGRIPNYQPFGMFSIIKALACQATRFLTVAAILIATACGGGNAVERDAAVRRAEQIAKVSESLGPLPAEAFRAELSISLLPSTMRTGQTEVVRVRVKNTSNASWPAQGRKEDGYFQVNLGNIWYNSRGEVVADGAYVRTGFPVDVNPGEEVELPLTITAPRAAGDYILEIDLVQEMVSWFHDKGSESLKTKVNVK